MRKNSSTGEDGVQGSQLEAKLRQPSCLSLILIGITGLISLICGAFQFITGMIALIGAAGSRLRIGGFVGAERSDFGSIAFRLVMVMRCPGRRCSLSGWGVVSLSRVTSLCRSHSLGTADGSAVWELQAFF